MNKITGNAVESFFSNSGTFKSENTKVYTREYDESDTPRYLSLNDCQIARRDDEYDYFYDSDNTGSEEEIYLNRDAFSSKTTRELNVVLSRLNGILEFLNKPLIYEEDGYFFWKDGEEFKQGWNRI